MYTLGSAEFNQIIETPNNKAIKSRLVLLDDNTIIDKIKSLILYSASCSQELQIGTTNMAYIDAEVESNLILTNREVRLECGVELSDGTVEYIPMGVFTIQKPQGDIDFVKFTANDRMQKFDYPYSSALTYPTTDKAMLEELATMCGVTLATNIDNPITIDKALDGYTRREVLGYIAGLHGKFACFNRNGELELKWYNTDSLITKNIGLIWGFEKSDEDFTVGKIEVAVNSETTLTSGNGYGVVQHSNPLATQEIVNDLFTSLNGFTYNASVVDMLDDIRLDLGDVIKVTYLDGKDYLVPCMSIKQDFTQGSTNIESFAKSDTENTYRFTGPTVQYLNRMAMELLVANRVIATKVDAEYVNSHAITTENFEAKIAEITELVVDEIDGKYANIDLANIDIANINVGKIGELFAKVGLIDRATIVEGHITGFLDAVEINANKITAGTLVADRILLSGGDKGVLYALNNLGELTSTNVDTLDGYVLTDRTITADKIVAKSITTNELDVDKIFGNEAVLNKLVSQEIFSDAVATNTVVVGARKDAKEALDLANSTNTASGSPILLTDSADGTLIDFKAYGRSTQKQGNFYDGELLQGYYATDGSVTSYAGRASAKNLIPCSEGNEISFKYSETASQLLIAFFKAGAWTSQVTAQNTSIVNATVPSGVDTFGITICQDGITPSNAKTISVKVNGSVGYPNPDYPQDIKNVGDMGYFDGELLQGYYNTDGTVNRTAHYVSAKNLMPCNGGDVIKFTYAETVTKLVILFFDDTKYLSQVGADNSTQVNATAPSGATRFGITIQSVKGITPQNAKKITVTINDKYALIVKSFKQEFDGELLQGAYSGATGNWMSSSTYICNKNMMSCKANDKIKLKYAEPTNQLMILYYDSNKNFLSYAQAQATSELETTAVANACYFNININNVNGITVAEAKEIIVCINDQHNTSYIPLNEPLRSNLGETVKDEVNLGENKITRRFAEVIFDGSDDEGWIAPTIPTGGYEKATTILANKIKAPNRVDQKPNILCTHYVKRSANDTYNGIKGISVNTGGTLFIYDENYNTSDVSLFKTWLQANPITVIYELAEPITEEIEPVDIVTYDNVTYLTASDNAEMWVQYYRNTPTGIQLAKLSTIERDNNRILANWASDNDITLIDGAKIYTGSITADKINVSDLFAQDIVAIGSITSPLLKSDDYVYDGATFDGEEYSTSGMIIDLREKIIRTPKFCLKNDGSMYASEIHGGRYYGSTSTETAFIFNGFTGGTKETTDLLKVSGNTADGTTYTTYINTDNDNFSFYKPCLFPYGIKGDLTIEGNTTLEGNTTVIGNVYANGDIIAGHGTDNQVSLNSLRNDVNFLASRWTTKSTGEKGTVTFDVSEYASFLLFCEWAGASLYSIYYINMNSGIVAQISSNSDAWTVTISNNYTKLNISNVNGTNQWADYRLLRID